MPAIFLSTRRWFSTLKFRIVLLAALTGFLSAVGTAYIVLHSAQRSIERVVLQAAKTDRERVASLLGGKVSVLRDALSAVARRTPVLAWSDPQAMQRYLLDKPALDSMFNSVFAADQTGRMLTRIEKGTVAEHLPSVADRDYFRRAIASDQPVLSDVIVGKITHEPMIVVVIPVPGPDGKALGVVAGTLVLRSVALFDELKASAADDAVWDLVVDRIRRAELALKRLLERSLRNRWGRGRDVRGNEQCDGTERQIPGKAWIGCVLGVAPRVDCVALDGRPAEADPGRGGGQHHSAGDHHQPCKPTLHGHAFRLSSCGCSGV